MKHLYTLLAIALPVLFGPSLNAQCGSLFFEGFESGTYTPTWTVGTAPITWNVSTTNPASGTYCVEGTGGNSTHLQGLMASFTPATPSSISFDIYPNGTSAGNYVVGGDASMAASNCVFFCYVTSGQFRFVSSVTYVHSATTLNQWMHVELRNINWTARTFDIYVNNVLAYTSFPFRTSTQSTISRIHLYNFTSGTTGRWDNITLGGVPITSVATSTSTLCSGSADGTASVTASGGNGVYTYLWSNSATSSNVSGLTAGSYSVVVTDGLGCMDTAYATITSPSAIAITATPSDVLCNGGFSGSIDASVTGGTGAYTYLWSNAAMTEDVSGLGVGTYSLYVVDANNCVDSLTGITVNQPSALTTSSVNTNPACNGDATGSSTVTANGGTAGYTYAWLPGGETTAAISGLTAGTYSCTVTDANGCTTMETMTIVDPVAISVLINAPDTICEGNSAVLMASGSGGTGSLSYVWQPGNLSGSTVTVSPSSTAMQYVVITDSLGCTHTDSTLLTVRMSPSVMLGSDIQQCGGTVVLDAQNSGMLYLWNDNSTSQTLNVAVSGTYFVSVSDSFGCAGSDTINVTLNANPTLYLGADTTQCGGAVVLDAQIAGGTYMWSDSSTSQTLSATISGVYWVNVVDANGCSTADTIVVTINAVPTVTASANTLTACALDADIILTGSPSNGTWSGTSVSGNLFDPSVGAGSYSPFYTYTDANGCTGTAGVTIVVSECTGISENSSAALMTLYPNPNSGQFNIVFAADASDVIVEITDVEGRTVQTQQLNSVVAGANNTISMENTANGFYFVKVIANGSSTTQRISVVR
ncbi:MAG: T9SS type A sorting domain-containing protein [Bacteroidia bacterium]|nr:T9SS type A sorting domain-containing protein [Bacteroidia bacterium]